jgi:hypothetical protein
MSKVVVRAADAYDLPFIREEMQKQDVEEIDLDKAVTSIAEVDGRPFTSLSITPAWLVEPTLTFNTEGLPTNTIRRGMYLNYVNLDRFIKQQAFTKQFCHIPEELPNVEWSRKMGFTTTYRTALKWLSKD